MIDVDVRDAAVEVAGPAWDRLVEALDLPGLWRADAISAYARAGAGRVRTVLAHVDGAPAALACFRSAPGDGDRGGSGGAVVPHAAARTWMCTPPVSYSPGLVSSRELAPADRRRLRAAMERAVLATVAPGPCLLAYPDLTGAQLDAMGPPRVVVQVAPTAVLDVAWDGVGDYLASLPRRRRRRFARLLDDVTARDLERIEMRGSDVDAGAFVDLERRTRARHVRGTVAPLPDTYVRAVVEAPRAGFFGYRTRHGRLLQADLAFVGGRTLTVTATGAEDRDLADGLYDAVMLSEIGWAIERGLARVEVGPGALAHKGRFGCRSERRYAAVFPRVARRRAIRRLAGTRAPGAGRGR